MAERKLLIEGLHETPPPIDSAKAKEFIYNTTANGTASKAKGLAGPTTQVNRVTRVHFTTRLRQDFAHAIKEASLKRQLEGISPSTVQDIIEQAIEPWLRDNGYLP